MKWWAGRTSSERLLLLGAAALSVLLGSERLVTLAYLEPRAALVAREHDARSEELRLQRLAERGAEIRARFAALAPQEAPAVASMPERLERVHADIPAGVRLLSVDPEQDRVRLEATGPLQGVIDLGERLVSRHQVRIVGLRLRTTDDLAAPIHADFDCEFHDAPS